MSIKVSSGLCPMWTGNPDGVETLARLLTLTSPLTTPNPPSSLSGFFPLISVATICLLEAVSQMLFRGQSFSSDIGSALSLGLPKPNQLARIYCASELDQMVTDMELSLAHRAAS
jgi:hypothetical protein